MNKKVLPVISAGLMCAVIGALTIGNTSGVHFGVAEETTYSINFDSTTNVLDLSSTETTDIAIVETDLGNELVVTYSNVNSASNGWLTLNAGGYIENYDGYPISGMTSITITVSETTERLRISYTGDYQYSGERFVVPFDGGTSYTFNFENTEPNYFKVENDSDVAVTIVSMSITYSCTNSYSVFEVTSNNENAGTILGSGAYRAGDLVTAAIDSINLGYVFDGWYEGETCVSTSTVYEFTYGTHASLEARFSVDSAMSAFNFTSTVDTCTITGLVDDTVTSFTIPSYVTAIGDEVFGLTDITSITIPDSVTSIGSLAFYGCMSLMDIVIGSGVTSVGSEAFDSCETLTNIYYNGTSAGWDAITFADNTANPTCYAGTLYYYSESEPSDTGNYWRYVDGVPTAW